MRSIHAPKAHITDEVCITHKVRITFRQERIVQKSTFVNRQRCFFVGGRKRTRTADLLRVKQACGSTALLAPLEAPIFRLKSRFLNFSILCERVYNIKCDRLRLPMLGGVK